MEDPEKSPKQTKKEDDDYNPHDHREVHNPTSNFETLVHLLKGSLGTGILAMPDAFSNSGIIIGVIGTILLGAMVSYCVQVLIRTQYKMCKREKVPYIGYPESLEMALLSGPKFMRCGHVIARKIVNIFLLIYQVGSCSVYSMFIAENIKQVVENYQDIRLNVRIYILLVLVPLILVSWIRNLKLLAPFSTIANFVTFTALGITYYYLFTDIPDLSERALVGYIGNYPLFIGTTLFALEAIGVIISLELNMKTPASFVGYTGVLNRGLSTIVLLYMFTGLMGYIKYGSDVRGSITLSLPTDEGLAQSVKIMIACAMFVTYAVQYYVIIDIIWIRGIMKKYTFSSTIKETLIEYTLRTGIVLLTGALAIAVPELGLFISLFGAFCLSTLGIIFPSIIELCYVWNMNEMGKFYWILIKDIFLLILGIFALIIGTYTAVRDIIFTMTG